MPGEERPSYAGAKVKVLELPDGTLRVQHESKTIPAREAPRSPGALRAISGALAATPELGGIVSRLVKYRLTQPQLRNLASLDAFTNEDDQNADTRPETPEAPQKPVPTPRQLALWKAVQHAKLQSVSLRGIARELGIARNTVRRYAYATSPPANRLRAVPEDPVEESIPQFSD